MRKFVILIMVLCLPTLIHSQKVGTVGAQFLKIGVGARPAGMGDAYIAVCNDATACFWNPAALAQIEKREVFLGHVEWFADIRCESFAYTQMLGNLGRIAVFGTFLGSGDIDETTMTDYGGTGNTFQYQAMASGLSFARQLTALFSVGANLKFVREDYGGYSDVTTWGMDMGTFYRTGWKSLRLGMSILHFGPELTPDGTYEDWEDGALVEDAKEYGSYSMPMTFRFGSAMEIIDSEHQKLTLACDAIHPNDNLERIHFGGEYTLFDMLSLRCGYKYQTGEQELYEEGITFGTGFKLSLGERGINIDYAFGEFGYLPDVHRVSMGMKF